MLKKTDKPGEFYDEKNDKFYMIRDVRPEIRTIQLGEYKFASPPPPYSALLRPQAGEEYVVYGLDTDANIDGNLRMEVNRLTAIDLPIKKLNLAHSGIALLKDAIATILANVSVQKEIDTEKIVGVLNYAIEKFTMPFGSSIPSFAQLLTHDHECVISAPKPIMVDVYMSVKRAWTKG